MARGESDVLGHERTREFATHGALACCVLWYFVRIYGVISVERRGLYAWWRPFCSRREGHCVPDGATETASADGAWACGSLGHAAAYRGMRWYYLEVGYVWNGINA